MNIVAIVQARMGSSRFPGKVAKPLGTTTVLGMCLKRLKLSKVIVCQNEIPLKCTIKALQTARKHSIISIFNCAPALPLAQLEEAIDSCDILCPNETELSTLTGTSTSSNEDIVNASLMVLNKCPNCKIHSFTHSLTYYSLIIYSYLYRQVSCCYTRRKWSLCCQSPSPCILSNRKNKLC